MKPVFRDRAAAGRSLRFAVADAYEIWRDLAEDEVAALLGL